MSNLAEFSNFLKQGQVYRRADLAQWSSHHLQTVQRKGTLKKLARGLYHVPKQSVFGEVPPEEELLIRSFLKEERFLLTTPNLYNSLGLGTTQLYNLRIVYNHKRRGAYKLGNQLFHFRVKRDFPEKLTKEFLLVDLVNNLNSLAEDRQAILQRLSTKAPGMDQLKLKQAVANYGHARTRKFFAGLFR